MATPRLLQTSERIRARLLESLPGRMWLRLREVEFLDRAVVLAAEMFLALIPMLIVVAALLPSEAGQAIISVSRSRLGLTGGSQEALGDLVAAREDIQGSVGIISVVLAVATATSFTRALQRVYERAWRLPPAGPRESWRGVAWLAGTVAYIGLIGLAAQMARGLSYATPIGGLVAAFGLWWWSQRMLTARRVRWRALVPGAAFTAVGMVTLTLLSGRIVPRMVESNERTFGPSGAIFALVSWLIVICTVLVVTAVVGAALAQEEGPIGRLTRRGVESPDGWREPRASRSDAERHASSS